MTARSYVKSALHGAAATQEVRDAASGCAALGRAVVWQDGAAELELGREQLFARRRPAPHVHDPRE